MWNIQTLALLLCHLFIDGNFQNAHILHDPNVLDGHLLTSIESICPYQIPWLTTDISEKSPLLWNMNENTDRILQLIFIDPIRLPESIEKLRNYFTFYRIFVFHSLDENQVLEQMATIKKLSPINNSSTLIVYYDENNDLICMNVNGNTHSITIPNSVTSIENVNFFDVTFGEHERSESIVIGVSAIILNKDDPKSYSPVHGFLYFANYFSSVLNAPYINITRRVKRIASIPEKTLQSIHKPTKYHKELSLDYESSVDGKQ